MGNTKRAEREKRNGERTLTFDKRLVLNQWMLGLFGVTQFEELARNLRDPRYEGFDENNVSRFHHNLKLLVQNPALPSDLLLAYDANIVRHWKRISQRRNTTANILYPKYFQYLSLLFTEVYLDRYFRDPAGLLAELNAKVKEFNARPIPVESRVEPYAREDLNKIAFWMATGSGKTLLMHVNILQYQHYLKQHGRERDLNRIILLTPNEGLSYQHLEEFQLSGIDAEIFSKNGKSLFTGKAVEIIDIHKLREEMGEKTVAIDAFEGNNLVLVDEGHRGMSGAEIGAWMQTRNQLCAHGFSFEYSATFGQAMKASGSRGLEQSYAKWILVDYSYKYFYGDGYGKDYRILNLPDDRDASARHRYLTASLLSFYEQQRVYQDHKPALKPFLIEHPLWVFVGSTVNVVRKEDKKNVSDVVEILLVLSEFVQDRKKSIDNIDRLLKDRSGLLDARGRDLFANSFRYINTLRLTAEQVYADVLRRLFNAPAPAGLHVENLKGTDGEIALRLGNNEPFGVINVGDASALCKLCREHAALAVEDKEFSTSLFRALNDEASTIHILIGSKRFTEGWNSWRVSTMGLLNVGRNEGPQVIQLFGRGVRLKGKDFSLKRSRRIENVMPSAFIDIMETLNIFGVRADYMRQFKEYLEQEGLPANEDRIEFVLPVIKDLGSKKLKTVRLKEGMDFKRGGPHPDLEAPPDYLRKHPVIVDWYPKLQAMASMQAGLGAAIGKREEQFFDDRQLAFLDLNAIYFELEQYKSERGWHTLCIRREAIKELLGRKDWYKLLIPREELHPRRFEDQLPRWQEIATTLLKKYVDRYYAYRKQEYEKGHLEYYELTEDDANLISEYRILIEQSRQDIVQKLQDIKKLIEAKKLTDVEFGALHAIAFAQHLYQPLLHIKDDTIEVRPIVLDENERNFVVDLHDFYDKAKDFFKDKELYLLRNLSRGRGIGFFEAGNFYPDFILWILTKGHQFITFVDPKGLRNLEGPADPKIRFCATVKELEQELADPEVTLNSIIISNTPVREITWWGDGMTKVDSENRHVRFQKEDRAT